MDIHCKYDELVDPETLTDHNDNPNKHDQAQIDRLAELYTYHGIRHPIIVDKERGVIAAGHGRKYAAIKAGVKSFPVVYQKFDSDDALYTFMVSDNAISNWSDLDLSLINLKLPDLGPMDLEMLGLKEFNINPPMLFKDEKDRLDTKNKEHAISIVFPDREEMMSVHNELSGRGYIVRIV